MSLFLFFITMLGWVSPSKNIGPSNAPSISVLSYLATVTGALWTVAALDLAKHLPTQARAEAIVKQRQKQVENKQS
jgi:hypothetical protein